MFSTALSYTVTGFSYSFSLLGRGISLAATPLSYGPFSLVVSHLPTLEGYASKIGPLALGALAGNSGASVTRTLMTPLPFAAKVIPLLFSVGPMLGFFFGAKSMCDFSHPSMSYDNGNFTAIPQGTFLLESPQSAEECFSDVLSAANKAFWIAYGLGWLLAKQQAEMQEELKKQKEKELPKEQSPTPLEMALNLLEDPQLALEYQLLTLRTQKALHEREIQNLQGDGNQELLKQKQDALLQINNLIELCTRPLPVQQEFPSSASIPRSRRTPHLPNFDPGTE